MQKRYIQVDRRINAKTKPSRVFWMRRSQRSWGLSDGQGLGCATMYINSHKARKEVINKRPKQRQRSKVAIRRELLFEWGGLRLREPCFLEVEASEANWRSGMFRRAAEPAPPALHAVSCSAEGQHLVCCDDVEVFLIKRSSAFPDAHLVRATSGWKGSWWSCLNLNPSSATRKLWT